MTPEKGPKSFGTFEKQAPDFYLILIFLLDVNSINMN